MLTRETELSILYEISSLSTRLREIDDVLALALDKATRLLGAQIAIVYLKPDDESQLYAARALGIQVTKVYSPISLTTDTTELYTRTHAWTAPQPSPYPHDPLRGRYPVQAAFGVPIRHESKLLGWLYAARLKPPFFEESHVALYNVLANQVANALELIRGRERDKRQREALTSANRQLEQLLAQQQDTIRELSTPVLKVADDVILLPLIGRIDPERSNRIMETMLESIGLIQASVVILDITGVSHVDTLVANVLLQATRAAKILGAEVVLCGVRPQVAHVLVSLDIQLGTLKLTNDLQTAIGIAFAHRPAGIARRGMSLGR